MATELIYAPIFRSRQQENLVLKSFDFKKNMYPLIEIVKEHDRKRGEEKQISFSEIYPPLVKGISSLRVFVDIPVYLKERASMKSEVLEFSRSVASSMEERLKHLLHFESEKERVIPVISSFLVKTGELGTINHQVKELRPVFNSIGFRILFNHFAQEWEEVSKAATEHDFIILDLDTIPPYPSPSLKVIINTWQSFSKCPRVVVRSAINTDIQNVNLVHAEIVFDADNGLLEQYKTSFKANGFGDYVGIKKDDLTSGGTISPGFLFYNAITNEFVGFKGLGGPREEKSIGDFETVIVPAVIASAAAKSMEKSGHPYLSEENKGWQTLLRIAKGEENGKSQAKFKKISMEHYLHCIKTKIQIGQLTLG